MDERSCASCSYQIAGMCSSPLFLQEIGAKTPYVVLDDIGPDRASKPCDSWQLSPRYRYREDAGPRPVYQAPSSGGHEFEFRKI